MDRQLINMGVCNTSTNQTEWENAAKRLLDSGPVEIMELVGDTYSIFARVVGYVDDPTYGKLLQVERVDAAGKGTTPSPEEVEG